MKYEFKKIKWKDNVRHLLFAVLVLSIAFAIVRIFQAPSDPTLPDQYEKLKSDYVLMLLQCVLGIIVMLIPSIVERQRHIDIPDVMEIAYFIFLYLAIYLGEVRDFYYLIPHWDLILHAFSGCMLGALGFTLVNFLNNTERLDIRLSPFFVALFAFCFALASGAVWEIYEFSADALLGLNMQKYALVDGTQLVGHAAVSDTMEDLIIDALSALAVSLIGYRWLKRSGANSRDRN